MKIPPKIHYCWFGRGEMPKMMKKCLKSWKKYCPGWEIVRWDEDSFDVNSTLWTKQAYEAKKYAFVADYVRLKVLYDQGGVYMDTDIELIKPMDEFLQHEAFSGFETPAQVQTGVMGAVAHHPMVRKWLSFYDGRPYIVDGEGCMTPNVKFMTEYLQADGFQLNDQYQEIAGVAIYPQTWFCPMSAVSIEKKITKDTHVIHHFTSTWRTEKALKDFARVKRHQRKWYKAAVWLRYLPNRVVRKIFGNDRIEKLKKLGK